jgi:DNA-binding NarL/FixJ family response regulator
VSRPRILLADDHGVVLEGLRRLLEKSFDVVGAVGDGRALLAAATRFRPDVILADISMPLLNGLDAARQIRALSPSSKIVFLTTHADLTYAAEAFDAGAAGYVVKTSAPSELTEAIHAVLRGERHVTRGLLASRLARPPLRGESPAGRLTARQREVLQLVAEGRSMKEIAGLLGVSVKTVEFHRARIAAALDLHSIAELARYAVAHGIVDR